MNYTYDTNIGIYPFDVSSICYLDNKMFQSLGNKSYLFNAVKKEKSYLFNI